LPRSVQSSSFMAAIEKAASYIEIYLNIFIHTGDSTFAQYKCATQQKTPCLRMPGSRKYRDRL